MAVTEKPILLKIPAATEPTPPVAPDTAIGKVSMTPLSKIDLTHAADVSPATPYDIASNSDIAFGRWTTQSAGTQIILPKPPLTLIPSL